MRKPMGRRAAAVAATAAAALLVSGSFALAEEDANTVSACVVKSSGNVRLLLDGATNCRNGEVLVQWSSGTGSAGDPLAPLAEEKDQSANGLVHWTQLFAVPDEVTGDHGLSDFIESLTTAPQTDSNATGLVHWDNLFDIPDWLDGTVGTEDITDGNINSIDLAGSDLAGLMVPGAVTSEKILDDTIESRDIASGAVTSQEILDGSISGGDIAASQVTADHLSLRHAFATDSSYEQLVGGVDTPSLGGSVAGAGTYLISGQAQLSLTDTTTSDTVRYQLVRDGGVGLDPVAVSPAYTTVLTPGQPQQVASVTVIESPAAGHHTYRLRIVGSAVDVSNTVLNVTELG